MRHLEHDYTVDRRETGFVPHFWDTIDAIGGYKGILFLGFGIFAFYFGVLFFITYQREKREAAKKRR